LSSKDWFDVAESRQRIVPANPDQAVALVNILSPEAIGGFFDGAPDAEPSRYERFLTFWFIGHGEPIHLLP